MYKGMLESHFLKDLSVRKLKCVMKYVHCIEHFYYQFFHGFACEVEM